MTSSTTWFEFVQARRAPTATDARGRCGSHGGSGDRIHQPSLSITHYRQLSQRDCVFHCHMFQPSADLTCVPVHVTVTALYRKDLFTLASRMMSRIFFYPDLQLLLRAARQVQVAASELSASGTGCSAAQHYGHAVGFALDTCEREAACRTALSYRGAGEQAIEACTRVRREHLCRGDQSTGACSFHGCQSSSPRRDTPLPVCEPPSNTKKVTGC